MGKVVSGKKNKILSWVVLLFYMYIMFCFSAQSGVQSNEISSGLLNAFVSPMRIFTIELNLAARSMSHIINGVGNNSRQSLDEGNQYRSEKPAIDENNGSSAAHKGQVYDLNWFFRKTAHFVEYFLLALLLYVALALSLKKTTGLSAYIIAVCAIYSVFDEFHQVFVPGRSPLISDVFIDIAGSAVFLIFFSKHAAGWHILEFEQEKS